MMAVSAVIAPDTCNQFRTPGSACHAISILRHNGDSKHTLTNGACSADQWCLFHRKSAESAGRNSRWSTKVFFQTKQKCTKTHTVWRTPIVSAKLHREVFWKLASPRGGMTSTTAQMSPSHKWSPGKKETGNVIRPDVEFGGAIVRGHVWKELNDSTQNGHITERPLWNIDKWCCPAPEQRTIVLQSMRFATSSADMVARMQQQQRDNEIDNDCDSDDCHTAHSKHNDNHNSNGKNKKHLDDKNYSRHHDDNDCNNNNHKWWSLRGAFAATSIHNNNTHWMATTAVTSTQWESETATQTTRVSTGMAEKHSVVIIIIIVIQQRRHQWETMTTTMSATSRRNKVFLFWQIKITRAVVSLFICQCVGCWCWMHDVAVLATHDLDECDIVKLFLCPIDHDVFKAHAPQQIVPTLSLHQSLFVHHCGCNNNNNNC